MALPARNCAMRTHQGIFRLGVIEAVDVRPGLYGVASLTAERCAIGALASHLSVEFAFVWVFVARSAGAVLEFEG